MKALQLTQCGSPGTFALNTLPIPTPGPGEVRIKVHACGLNHLDLWTETGQLPLKLQLPLTLGSEIAGTLDALGPQTSDAWQLNAPVTVQSNLFCGKCEFCLEGRESICLQAGLLGVTTHGGFAEYVIVPENSLVPIPASVTMTDAAALNLAASTAFHLLEDRAPIRPNQTVLVMGAASGVGSAAIQIAREKGAIVITTASTESKRQLALQLGAHHVIDLADPEWPKNVRNLTQKRGVDLIVEHLGGEILTQSFQCLARGGSIVTCGATLGRDVQVPLWTLFAKEQTLIGSYGRTRANIASALEWCAAKKLRPIQDRIIPLEALPQAFQDLHQRKVHGKVVAQILE